MKTQNQILLIFILLLIFIRAYSESYLVQLGLNDQQYSDFIRCTIIGCFLKFEYQLPLDILSLGTYLLLAKHYLKFDTKQGLITSAVFVLVFMSTDLYEIIGSLIGIFIPTDVYKSLEIDRALYWSFENFWGMLVSIIVMTVVVKQIKKTGPQ